MAVIAIWVTFSSLPAWSIGFQPVSPDELKMTAEPKAPGAPAIVLFREVDRDDRGLTAHEDVYYRIKILTEEGRSTQMSKFLSSRNRAMWSMFTRERSSPTAAR